MVAIGAIHESPLRKHWMVAVTGGVVLAVATVALALNLAGLRDRLFPRPGPAARALTQLTFEPGLNAEPTWSPDGRFIAYSSDRSGDFDIWVQPVGGGDPVQVTKDPAHDWQPDWSPKGDLIALRSERQGGGLYVVAALGGQERRISSFGFRPRWSSDGSRILFRSTPLRDLSGILNYFVVGLDGKLPRDIIREFIPRHRFFEHAAWQPDGERISFWGIERGPGARRLFWTAWLKAGSDPIASELRSRVRKQMEGASVELGDFAWAPSGRAIYFEGVSQGVRNLWKVTADPGTLRWIEGPERLTAGPGPDRDLALSADGKKLAFSVRRESTRIWLLPFNATTGKILGPGEPVTPAGVDALESDLTPDGAKLVFNVSPAGKAELWAKSLLDGKQTLLAKDDFVRAAPRWSPDGKRLVYLRLKAPPNQPYQQVQVVLLGEGGQGEQPLTSEYPPAPYTVPSGWSPDGKHIVLSRWAPAMTMGLWVLPVSDPARAEAEAHLVTFRPGYNLWQGRFSPDGNWICFNATKFAGAPGATGSTIFVVPATGGDWVRISEEESWSDKARWSPEGKTIYFVSSRTGFLNVWGRRFDPVRGQPVGELFQVASFENPSRTIPYEIGTFEISLSEDRLVVPITEITGNIWMLENVDR